MFGPKAASEGALAQSLFCASFTGRATYFFMLAVSLTAAAAICGTLEASSIAKSTDDVQVLNQENVAGPVEIEFLADCQRTEQRALKAAFSRPCRDNN